MKDRLLSIKVTVQVYTIDCNNLANTLMSADEFPCETDV